MPLIFKNVLRNRRRSILTALSIGGSFCMLGVLMAMYRMFFLVPASPDQALRLIVRHRISFTNPLPLSYENRIAAVPGVRQVMKYQWFGGTYKDSREFKNLFPRFAVDANKLFIVRPEYSISDSEKAAFIRERSACVLGRPLGQRLGVKIGDHISVVGDIFPRTLDFVVRGFYDAESDNENLYFHFDYLNEAVFHGQQDFVSMYTVLADRAESVPAIARGIDAIFRNSPQATKTETEKALQLSFLSYIGNVKLFLVALCGSLSLAVLFVAANTMAMNVRERVSEVGILKTLGFTRGKIMALFVGESMAVAEVGGAVGLGFAWLIVDLLHNAPIVYVDLKLLIISPPLAALALVLAGLVGVLSSALPAWTASRRAIIECLRLAD
ncbi:MAG TPA: FtsX-like permease family protein [Bryobacteraceae bacterium]|nr:FtsX-like permease family protein [Bryobacteraceae bacterium]